MTHVAIEPVASDLRLSLRQSRGLASAARQWVNPALGPRRPAFSSAHRCTLVELAFLRSFLAWESFLEETFLLYVLGKKPRSRKHPRKRFILPRDREHALELLLPEGRRDYVMWDNPEVVLARAKRFLKDGEPFQNALSPRLNALKEMQTIRNAIAHRSIVSQQKFSNLVRDRLGTLPLGITVGVYLETPIPSSTPPTLQLDRYLQEIEAGALAIAT